MLRSLFTKNQPEMSEAPAPCDRIGIGVSSGGSLSQLTAQLASQSQSLLPISFHVGSRRIPYWVSIDPTDVVPSRAPLIKAFKKVRLSTHGR